MGELDQQGQLHIQPDILVTCNNIQLLSTFCSIICTIHCNQHPFKFAWFSRIGKGDEGDTVTSPLYTRRALNMYFVFSFMKYYDIAFCLSHKKIIITTREIFRDKCEMILMWVGWFTNWSPLLCIGLLYHLYMSSPINNCHHFIIF